MLRALDTLYQNWGSVLGSGSFDWSKKSGKMAFEGDRSFLSSFWSRNSHKERVSGRRRLRSRRETEGEKGYRDFGASYLSVSLCKGILSE